MRIALVTLALGLAGCGNSHTSEDGGGEGMDGGGRDGGTVVLPDGRVIRPDAGRPGEDGGEPGDDAGRPGTDAGPGDVDAGDPRTDGRIGTPCRSNADCRGRFCSSGTSGVGYCTWVCAEDDPCPDGAVCFIGEESFGYCLLGCDGGEDDCPAGTRCWSAGVPEPVCIAGCTSDDDCAPGLECSGGIMGGRCFTRGAEAFAPCTRNEECGMTEVCADEASWGFAGGICLRPGCDPVSLRGCDEGSVCVEFGRDGNGLCLPLCMDMDDCRPGYACVGSPVPDARVCQPRCTDDSQCTDGRRCDFLTSRCF